MDTRCFAKSRAFAAERFRKLLLLLLVASIGTTQAHHTYAMFDRSKTQTLRGTVAKLEWTNPHVFVWLDVPSVNNPGKYDLYALIWPKQPLQTGEFSAP
jgi:hypothetical protein